MSFIELSSTVSIVNFRHKSKSCAPLHYTHLAIFLTSSKFFDNT